MNPRGSADAGCQDGDREKELFRHGMILNMLQPEVLMKCSNAISPRGLDVSVLAWKRGQVWRKRSGNHH